MDLKPQPLAGQKFLTELAALCDKFNAALSYTTDDDGIHITVGGEEVFVGFLLGGAGDSLRASLSPRAPHATYHVAPNGGGFSVIRRDPAGGEKVADNYVYQAPEEAHGVIQAYEYLDARLLEPALEVCDSMAKPHELVCVLAMGEPAELLKLRHDQQKWTGGVYEYQDSAFSDKISLPISAAQVETFYAKGVMTEDGRKLATVHPTGLLFPRVAKSHCRVQPSSGPRVRDTNTDEEEPSQRI